MRKLLISSIFAGSGTILYQYEYRYKTNQFKKEEVFNDIYHESFNVRTLTLLPLNLTSRFWGKLNNIDLPIFVRSKLLSIYIRRYNCDLSEAADPDLTHYSNLGEFFRRKLKSELRPIDQNHTLVSPCDGCILSANKIEANEIEQVKNMKYNINFFLGPNHTKTSHNKKQNNIDYITDYDGNHDDKTIFKNNVSFNEYLLDSNNCLYQCVIYLSPGDYHCFHSPTNWNCFYRRYFPGYLFSVSPKRASSIPQLFNLNERVGYSGKWIGGFFNLTAIGASNVGSILVYKDKKLSTNKKMIETEKFIQENFGSQLIFEKGEPFGEFNFGSTIVLIFEAHKNFKFVAEIGEKIKFGQALGK